MSRRMNRRRWRWNRRMKPKKYSLRRTLNSILPLLSIWCWRNSWPWRGHSREAVRRRRRQRPRPMRPHAAHLPPSRPRRSRSPSCHRRPFPMPRKPGSRPVLQASLVPVPSPSPATGGRSLESHPSRFGCHRVRRSHRRNRSEGCPPQADVPRLRGHQPKRATHGPPIRPVQPP